MLINYVDSLYVWGLRPQTPPLTTSGDLLKIKSLFPGKIRTALIFTMNAREDLIKTIGYDKQFAGTKMALKTIFGECEVLLSTDTLQYNDYDKYEHEIFDKQEKIKRHEEVFPLDCERAFELGRRMASE